MCTREFECVNKWSCAHMLKISLDGTFGALLKSCLQFYCKKYFFQNITKCVALITTYIDPTTEQCRGPKEIEWKKSFSTTFKKGRKGGGRWSWERERGPIFPEVLFKSKFKPYYVASEHLKSSEMCKHICCKLSCMHKTITDMHMIIILCQQVIILCVQQKKIVGLLMFCKNHISSFTHFEKYFLCKRRVCTR